MTDQELKARPFIKWVGGKKSIMPELIKRIPDNFTTYNEPFAGGAALLYRLNPKKANISDANRRLIMTYIAIKSDVELVIHFLEQHKAKHCKDYYYAARSRFNDPAPDVFEIAGLFIYLNKTCFNGLYRENKGGGYNVPMGDYKNPMICDEENLRSVSAALKNVRISHAGFEAIKPEAGAFYYLDPPYHDTYSGYGAAGFSDQHHIALAKKCIDIDAAGGKVMLSNSNTEFIRNLYTGFLIEEVSASRSVSRKGSDRGRKTEFLIRNYGDPE